ncbi:hypothetical protein K504DRAFT_531901 [Pleomassaria siparia CBS 279.74]|uniref:Uncharacterized protein n=1 Tax=Pleomassaria siparia CBS 279.74 TaxID=1314801 RepID=A0A6G1KEH7_9PLEO|nr:hypothetical protein K504DRAFT_531901 [Pleomassaria siparia CBS 279.74]
MLSLSFQHILDVAGTASELHLSLDLHSPANVIATDYTISYSRPPDLALPFTLSRLDLRAWLARFALFSPTANMLSFQIIMPFLLLAALFFICASTLAAAVETATASAPAPSSWSFGISSPLDWFSSWLPTWITVSCFLLVLSAFMFSPRGSHLVEAAFYSLGQCIKLLRELTSNLFDTHRAERAEQERDASNLAHGRALQEATTVKKTNKELARQLKAARAGNDSLRSVIHELEQPVDVKRLKENVVGLTAQRDKAVHSAREQFREAKAEMQRDLDMAVANANMFSDDLKESERQIKVLKSELHYAKASSKRDNAGTQDLLDQIHDLKKAMIDQKTESDEAMTLIKEKHQGELNTGLFLSPIFTQLQKENNKQLQLLDFSSSEIIRLQEICLQLGAQYLQPSHDSQANPILQISQTPLLPHPSYSHEMAIKAEQFRQNQIENNMRTMNVKGMPEQMLLHFITRTTFNSPFGGMLKDEDLATMDRRDIMEIIKDLFPGYNPDQVHQELFPPIPLPLTPSTQSSVDFLDLPGITTFPHDSPLRNSLRLYWPNGLPGSNVGQVSVPNVPLSSSGDNINQNTTVSGFSGNCNDKSPQTDFGCNNSPWNTITPPADIPATILPIGTGSFAGFGGPEAQNQDTTAGNNLQMTENPFMKRASNPPTVPQLNDNPFMKLASNSVNTFGVDGSTTPAGNPTSKKYLFGDASDSGATVSSPSAPFSTGGWKPSDPIVVAAALREQQSKSPFGFGQPSGLTFNENKPSQAPSGFGNLSDPKLNQNMPFQTLSGFGAPSNQAQKPSSLFQQNLQVGGKPPGTFGLGSSPKIAPDQTQAQAQTSAFGVKKSFWSPDRMSVKNGTELAKEAAKRPNAEQEMKAKKVVKRAKFWDMLD